MKPYYRDEAVAICLGDCREVLPKLRLVDAIVTDPPYGLEFMGQEWDKGVPGVEFWSACLRALKPGGHLLAFGGTRTHHRLWCAIEDAGFELRDTLMWLYGVGFPKSLDVSKSIDKHGGKSVSWFGRWLRSWRQTNGVTQREIAKLFPSKSGGMTGCVANWELGFNMPTAEQFTLICRRFDLPFESLEEAEREVVGQYGGDMGGLGGQRLGSSGGDVTIPATDAAKQWEGFGTALRPSWEPILLARKPLEGTVAENVLKHGVGGLNIDATRIETDWSDRPESWKRSGYGKNPTTSMFGSGGTGIDTSKGRWPANVLLDEEAAAQLDEQSGVSSGRDGVIRGEASIGYGGSRVPFETRSYGDTGGASRFFYVAKASRAERERDLKGVAPVSGAEAVNRQEGTAGLQSPRAGAGRTAATVKNPHPTVKPLALMRWLVLLVTPPNGVVLDPFMGSGTTLRAGKDLGRRAIGIEIEERYCEIAAKRMRQTTLGLSL